MNRPTVMTLAMAAAVAAAAWPSYAPRAQDVADFYEGRTVTVYVGVSPGGIYSTFAQILSRHMGQYIPGKPEVIVQHMEGAGGTKVNNYVYNVAPKDGTVVLTPNAGAAARVLLDIGNPKYDPAKFRWLGGWGEAVNTLTVLKGSPASTIEEAKKKELVLGAIGKSSNTYLIPALISNTLGTKFKIITGYRGGSPIRLAIEKGEVHGWSGQWLGWKLAKPDWIREGKLVHLLQLASKRAPDLPDVPLLTDFATNDEDRAMFRFVQTGIADRALVTPPDVPADRAAALGEAYQKTLRDPAFVAEAGKRQYSIDPIPGAEIQKFVEEMMNMPPSLRAKIRVAMGLD